MGLSKIKNKLYCWGDMVEKGFGRSFDSELTLEPTKVSKNVFR
jgi:hypothetical protein